MGKLAKLLMNPQKIAKIPELKYWVLAVLLLILIYTFLSNGDFSFMLTLSSILKSLSLLGILIQANTSPGGLSLNTFLIYSIIYFSRLCAIIPFDSYLPYDSTGDWFYQVIEICSLVQSVYISKVLSGIKESKNFLGFIAPLVVFSFIVHPSLNRNYLTDSLWMTSMMLESIAVLPLLWKIKANNDLESFSSHFIAASTFAQILSFIFWLQTYNELNGNYLKAGANSYSGYFVLGSQLFSLVLAGDFLIYYIKSAVLRTPLILPV